MAESDRTEFLKNQNEKKRAYRAKLKADKPVVVKEAKKVPISIDKNELHTVFGSLKTNKGEHLSKITVSNYSTKINRLAQMITGADYTDSKFLHDYAKVIKHITECDLKSKKDYITPIVRLLRDEGDNEKAIEKYLEFMGEMKSKEEHVRGENVLTKQSDKDNSMTLQEVMDRYKAYSVYDGDKLNLNKLLYKLIVEFYFDSNIVPRNDLGVFKLAKYGKKDLNPANNYVLMKGDVPYKIVMLAYKTASTYGRQTFDITEGLGKLLKLYISEFNKSNGDLLFTLKDEAINDNTFLTVIKKAMMDVVGKPLNVDLIRSIIITDFHKTPHSINDKKLNALKFLHSPDMQQEYIKLNIE